MDSEDFLNNTELNSSPGPPLKSSTLQRQNRQQLKSDDEACSFNFPKNESNGVLNEVTNFPNFNAAERKYTENVNFSYNDSSLGILHMENISGFTEASFMSLKTKPSHQYNYFHNPDNEAIKPVSFDTYKNESQRYISTDYKQTDNPAQYQEIDKNFKSSGSSCDDENKSLDLNGVQKHFESSMQDKDVHTRTVDDLNAVSVDPTKTRESIFKGFEISFDSLKSFRPENKNSAFPSAEASHVNSILQNQTAAEEKFLKMVDGLQSVNFPLTFSEEEISSRSTSFGSSRCKSQTNVFGTNLSNHAAEDLCAVEGFQDGIDTSVERTSDVVIAKEKQEKSAKSENKSVTGYEVLENNLIYINTSEFVPNNDEIRFSDSEFFAPSEALELFNKEEELHIEEHKFEIGFTPKTSSVLDSDSSWLKECAEKSSVERQFSIGSIFQARSENVGRLSEDSQRERPYFGVNVSTPVHRGQDISPTAGSFSSTFRQSDASSVLSSNQNDYNKTLGSRTISQILNDTSNLQPEHLAAKIIERCNLTQNTTQNPTRNHQTSIMFSRLPGILEETSPRTPTTTRSSSPESIPRLLNESEKDLNGSNILHSRSSHPNLDFGHCPPCRTCHHDMASCNSRPPSSCSSVHTNQSCHHGAMAYCGAPYPQFNLGLPHMQYHPCSQHYQCQSFNVQSGMFFPKQGYGPYMGGPSAPFPFAGSYPLINGPDELKFPQKICIGDCQTMSLSVQSVTTSLHLYYVSCISVQLNGEFISNENSGVSYPSIVLRSNEKINTDIKLTLSPNLEGTFIVTLQVIASCGPSELSMTSGGQALKTKIQFEAVRPQVSILSGDVQDLDLGLILTDNQASHCITVMNKCEAAVPLCLNLSNDMNGSSISFERATGWKMISPKVVLCRLSPHTDGATSSAEVPILVKAGKKECDVNFFLNVTMESAMCGESLGFLRIAAKVSDIKLVLSVPSENPTVMRAKVGSIVSQALTLKNESRQPVSFILSATGGATSCFHISPASGDLRPQQSAHYNLSFKPSAAEVVKGYFQAVIQPHGKTFSLVELIGDSTASSRRNEAGPRTSEVCTLPCSLIACNAKFLAWCGVEIGSTEVKTFNVKNTSSKSLIIKLFIKEKSKSFKLLYDESVLLSVGEERNISVAFCAQNSASVSGILAMKTQQDNESKKSFLITLFGYGGPAQLTCEVEKPGFGNCLNIRPPSDRTTVCSSISLQNPGLRPIFVKAVVSIGGAEADFNQDKIVISPSQFVLSAKTNKTLYVTCSPQYFATIFPFNNDIITLFYGDEVMRQQLKRCRRDESKHILMNGLDFESHFEDEAHTAHDPLLQNIIKFPSVFSKHIKKCLIYLNVDQSADNSHMTFDALPSFANLTADSTVMSTRRMTSNLASTSYVQNLKDMMSRLSMNYHASELELSQMTLPADATVCKKVWTLTPEVLTIDGPNKDNRVLLINHSSQDLKYKTEYSIDVVSVSPASGSITARGQIGLRVTIIPGSYNKLKEDHEVTVKVICDATDKILIVKVLKRSHEAAENKTAIEMSNKDSSKSYMEKTLMNSINILDISEFPKEVKLNPVLPNNISETIIKIQNKEKCCVRWNIKPFSTEISKIPDETVIQIPTPTGSLKSKEEFNFAFKFAPSQVGAYYQYFELVLHYENDMRRTSIIHVSGEACSPSAACCAIPNLESDLFKKPLQMGVIVETSNLDFPDTALGQSSTLYVVVKNTTTSHDAKLNIIKPQAPFVIKVSSVILKSKKFLKIPVHFKPNLCKFFEDTLILQEYGLKYTVKLTGTCQ